MKYPKIDLEEIEEMKKRNFKERLKFIEFYVNYLKKTPNKKWSSEQNKIINTKNI